MQNKRIGGDPGSFFFIIHCPAEKGSPSGEEACAAGTLAGRIAFRRKSFADGRVWLSPGVFCRRQGFSRGGKALGVAKPVFPSPDPSFSGHAFFMEN